MRHFLLLLVLTASCAWAQPIDVRIPFPAGFPAQLKEFLELTTTQVNSIEQLNNRFQRYQSTRTGRQFQVQAEIGQETGREVIDPMALGVRYRELELIRREVEAERTRTLAELQAVLTPPQRTKLGTLEQAMRLQGTACDAVQQNLLAVPNVIPASRFAPSITSLLLGLPTSGCGSSLPAAFGLTPLP